MTATNTTTAKRHYIGMAGLCGCMPSTCGSYTTKEAAIDSLCAIHDSPRGMRTQLRRHNYADLNIARDGNEYAEIIECYCDSPSCHDDC